MTKTIKARVTLSNSAGPLDEKIVSVTTKHSDPDERMSLAIEDVIGEWSLRVGDTITITEVAP